MIPVASMKKISGRGLLDYFHEYFEFFGLNLIHFNLAVLFEQDTRLYE